MADGLGSVLLLGLPSNVVADVLAPLVAAGFDVQIGAVADVARQPWKLVVSGPANAGLGSMELVASMQALLVTPRLLVVGSSEALPPPQLGVQCLAWPFEPTDLVKIALGLVPDPMPLRKELPEPTPMHLLQESEFLDAVITEREELRAGRSPGESFVVVVRLDELERFRDRLSARAEHLVWQQVALLAGEHALADEKLCEGDDGDLLMLLPGTSRREAALRLQELSSLPRTTRSRCWGNRCTCRRSLDIGRYGAAPAQSAQFARHAKRRASRHSTWTCILQFTKTRPRSANAKQGCLPCGGRASTRKTRCCCST